MRKRNIYLYIDTLLYKAMLAIAFLYRKTSMARTSLGPWKFIREMVSSSHCGFNHGARSGRKSWKYGEFVFIFYTIWYVVCSYYNRLDEKKKHSCYCAPSNYHQTQQSKTIIKARAWRMAVLRLSVEVQTYHGPDLKPFSFQWSGPEHFMSVPRPTEFQLVILFCSNIQVVLGDDWMRQRCRVSCVTGVSNKDWLTDGQGLLSVQQVRVEGGIYHFFCFFTIIHFPLPPMSLSFIFSTISSISLLLSFWRRHKMTHKGWHVVKLHYNQSGGVIWHPTQWAHNVKMTSYQRRCDVITSHRRWYDVILIVCACWEGIPKGLNTLFLLGPRRCFIQA